MPTWCNNVIYWCILSSTCFGYIRPSSGAIDVKLQHMVFCTEFVDGWWSWQPLRRSCVRCGWWRVRHHPHRTLDQNVSPKLRWPTTNVHRVTCLKIEDHYCTAANSDIKIHFFINLSASFHISGSVPQEICNFYEYFSSIITEAHMSK